MQQPPIKNKMRSQWLLLVLWLQSLYKSQWQCKLQMQKNRTLGWCYKKEHLGRIPNQQRLGPSKRRMMVWGLHNSRWCNFFNQWCNLLPITHADTLACSPNSINTPFNLPIEHTTIANSGSSGIYLFAHASWCNENWNANPIQVGANNQLSKSSMSYNLLLKQSQLEQQMAMSYWILPILL